MIDKATEPAGVCWDNEDSEEEYVRNNRKLIGMSKIRIYRKIKEKYEESKKGLLCLLKRSKYR